MSVKQVAILGSTGSIGVNTLDVIRAHPDRFNVVALTAAKQVDLLAQQCFEFKPAIAVVSNADGAAHLRKLLLEKNDPLDEHLASRTKARVIGLIYLNEVSFIIESDENVQKNYQGSYFARLR